MTNKIDLLKTVEYGGCSAKISAEQLSELLKEIHIPTSEKVLVDITTHDDAGVYKISDDRALIVTTDFFPPICSDPFEFGQIAAANSLSDVYAMGGKPLLALNLNMFPSKTLPLEALRDIIAGGQDKINEAKAFTMGGHTIEDATPKYGLAVVGEVHPDKVISNNMAKQGDKLILTKPIGTGILVAAQRMGLALETSYRAALEQMKTLNDLGAEIMQKFGVRCATDVTGFGLLGHMKKMAEGSEVTICLDAEAVPVLPEVLSLLEDGCIPGAAFRNLDFVKKTTEFSPDLSTELKMLLCDAQTSGGLLMCVPEDKVEDTLSELLATGKHSMASVIGEVKSKGEKSIIVR